MIVGEEVFEEDGELDLNAFFSFSLKGILATVADASLTAGWCIEGNEKS